MASAVTSSCPDFVPVPSLALLSTSQLRLGESSCTGLALASNWSWKKPNQSSFWRSFPLKKRPPLFSGSGQPCASALGWPHPFPPVQGGLARPSWPTANTAYPHVYVTARLVALFLVKQCKKRRRSAQVGTEKRLLHPYRRLSRGPSQSEAEARFSPPIDILSVLTPSLKFRKTITTAEGV